MNKPESLQCLAQCLRVITVFSALPLRETRISYACAGLPRQHNLDAKLAPESNDINCVALHSAAHDGKAQPTWKCQ